MKTHHETLLHCRALRRSFGASAAFADDQHLQNRLALQRRAQAQGSQRATTVAVYTAKGPLPLDAPMAPSKHSERSEKPLRAALECPRPDVLAPSRPSTSNGLDRHTAGLPRLSPRRAWEASLLWEWTHNPRSPPLPGTGQPVFPCASQKCALGNRLIFPSV